LIPKRKYNIQFKQRKEQELLKILLACIYLNKLLHDKFFSDRFSQGIKVRTGVENEFYRVVSFGIQP